MQEARGAEAPDPDLERQVGQAQVRLFTQHASSSFSAAMIVSVLLTLYFWRELAGPTLLAWIGYQVFVTTWRFRTTRALTRLADDAIDVAYWCRRIRLETFFAGLGWGVGEILFYQVPSAEHQVLVAVTLPALCGAALATLSVVPRNYSIFMLWVMLPFLGVHLVRGGSFGYTLVTLGTLFIVTVLSVSRRIHAMMTDVLRLGLQNRRLRDLAEASNEAKSAFLSSVSHELRTPMTSIVGFVRLIRKKLDEVVFPRVDAADDKVRRAVAQVRGNLDIMVAESERLTLLINDVLDSAKLESGKVEWQLEALQPAAMLAQAVAVVAPLAEQKDLNLSWSAEAGLPAVAGDAARMQQVLINLLSNAVKFTPRRGAIAANAAPRSDGFVVFDVRDSGIGIAPEHQDQVFDKFRQLGDTLTDKPHGTGLGLSICRQIVEAHGGRIWVESSSLGAGSVFRFTLPVAG
ncbi:MAG TPA: HAMP domain-containing sensor histidine kinase [Rhodocyclaceae bacterium]